MNELLSDCSCSNAECRKQTLASAKFPRKPHKLMKSFKAAEDFLARQTKLC